VSRRRLDLPGTSVARPFQGAAPKAATPFGPTCWILYICLHWHLRDYNCFQRDHHSRLTGGSLGVQNSPYKKPFRSIHGQWQDTHHGTSSYGIPDSRYHRGIECCKVSVRVDILERPFSRSSDRHSTCPHAHHSDLGLTLGCLLLRYRSEIASPKEGDRSRI